MLVKGAGVTLASLGVVHGLIVIGTSLSHSYIHTRIVTYRDIYH